jgi:predicted ATP-dependent serine protease
MNVVKREVKVERRGRPKKQVVKTGFQPNIVELFRGNDLEFNESLFVPLKTNTEMDIILSTDGGLMPGTSMMIAGGPGSGKSTLVMDMLSKFTQQGLKCLLVQGEMDQIGHYKYCRRMPSFGCIQTLFLKDYMENIKETIEHVFNLGYDVIAVDSIAEVLDMYKDQNGGTSKQAESWFLKLQDNVKKGKNSKNYYTSFINIQQMTKSDEFAGSNRLKHMMEAFCKVQRSKDGLERSMHFEKNRDCDKDFKVFFSIYQDGVHYAFEKEDE